MQLKEEDHLSEPAAKVRKTLTRHYTSSRQIVAIPKEPASEVPVVPINDPARVAVYDVPKEKLEQKNTLYQRLNTLIDAQGRKINVLVILETDSPATHTIKNSSPKITLRSTNQPVTPIDNLPPTKLDSTSVQSAHSNNCVSSPYCLLCQYASLPISSTISAICTTKHQGSG